MADTTNTAGKLEHWASVRVTGHELAWEASEGMLREMDTSSLKALWDRDWPLNDVIDGCYLEHVHAELTARGEGAYCAV